MDGRRPERALPERALSGSDELDHAGVQHHPHPCPCRIGPRGPRRTRERGQASAQGDRTHRLGEHHEPVRARGARARDREQDAWKATRAPGSTAGAKTWTSSSSLAIDRAKELFGAAYANVQPHSGTQANHSVLFALLKPGDRILSMDLAAGGHLSHGSRANLSGRWFDSHHYGVDRATGLLDYDAVEARARELRPTLLIAGGSAYPRQIDFERMARIASSVGARLLVDMAHVAGLVAAGVHESPLPHADFVTGTTTKTLRGPRGGFILARSTEFEKVLQSAVFPGVQGSLHPNVLAAKAVCLGEALRPGFRDYGRRVVENARALAGTLAEREIGIVAGGTDTHMVLLDLASSGLLGMQAEAALARAGITSNDNPIAGDAKAPAKWTGLRLGVAAATTRGLKPTDMRVLAGCIADLLVAESRCDLDETLARVKPRIERLIGP